MLAEYFSRLAVSMLTSKQNATNHIIILFYKIRNIIKIISVKNIP